MLPVYSGRSAVLNCSTYRYDSLQWVMSNKLISLVPELQHISPTLTKDGLWLHSTLTIPSALLEHNDSTITCIGVQIFNSIGENQRRDCQFYVQGTETSYAY